RLLLCFRSPPAPSVLFALSLHDALPISLRVSLSSLATIVVLNLLGALSPGPDTILITRLATKSRRHAIAAVTGIQVGVYRSNSKIGREHVETPATFRVRMPPSA